LCLGGTSLLGRPARVSLDRGVRREGERGTRRKEWRHGKGSQIAVVEFNEGMTLREGGKGGGKIREDRCIDDALTQRRHACTILIAGSPLFAISFEKRMAV
jgi:hypothetical protein